MSKDLAAIASFALLFLFAFFCILAYAVGIKNMVMAKRRRRSGLSAPRP